MKKKSLLGTCLLISLSVHVFVLFFFTRTPLLVQNRLASLFKKSAVPLSVLTQEEEDLLRQEELEEAFDQFVTLPKALPFDYSHQLYEHIMSPAEEVVADTSSKEDLGLENQEELPSLYPPSTFALNLDHVGDLEEGILEEGILPQLQFEKTPSFDPKKELASSIALDEVDTVDDLGIDSMPITANVESDLDPVAALESFKQTPMPNEDFSAKSTVEPLQLPQNSSDQLALMELKSLLPLENKSVQFSTLLPEIEDYSLPEVARALPWDDAFDVKVELIPNPENQGFVFTLNLTPTDEVDLTSMPQNFYFLIDRSSSIPRHRFGTFKRATLKALTCLREGDKFNIILFDKKVKRLSAKPIPFSKMNYKRAQEFLEKQEHGTAFASADLFAALKRIIPKEISDEEAHSAILITDGESSQAPVKQHKNISEWLKQNAGKVTLYTAAVGKNNNLLMLDLLSTATGGRLIYSDTHAAFPRRLGKLILNLHGPLIKDLQISAQPKNPETEIRFHPSTLQMPTLFTHRPYEIVGSASSLTDFTLLITGKHKNRNVMIAKEISLKNAFKGNRLLEKKWAGAKAKTKYSEYLTEGKVAHLLKAKELLKSSGYENLSSPK